ncbi:MAG: DEAD/DEAH box helicase [Promethearchaeota archaeon]
MNLSSPILEGLTAMNIISPTDIQEQAIPTILSDPKAHVIAQAKTGSGKTLAFSIPLVQLLDRNLKKVQAVIIVPTRELCLQISLVILDLSHYSKLHVVQIYGGVSINRQMQEISKGAQIVVATPGRLIDIYNRGKIDFRKVKYVVLDEADRCLDMGFMPDIEYILLNAMGMVQPRLFLFSATMFGAINHLIQKFTRDEPISKIDVSQDSLTVEQCDQIYYVVREFRDKYYDFVRIFKKEHPNHSLIFVNTKKTAEWLYNRLSDEKQITDQFELISGNLTQYRRESVLAKFRSNKIQHLIATDVAARGLDIKGVSHVFNYDIPSYEENYVHRIGRTARVRGKDGYFAQGTAISLVLRDELALLARIEGFMEKDLKKRPLPPRNKGRNNTNRNYRRDSNPNSNSNTNPNYNRRGDSSRDRYLRRGPRKSDEPRPQDKANRRNFLY